MIDATTPLGMARLLLLLETGCDCWRVLSIDEARRWYAQGVKTLSAI